MLKMSEQNQSETTRPVTADLSGLFKIGERFGIPLLLLVAVSYVTFNEIIKPIASKYVDVLDEVKTNNKELKDALFLIGESNKDNISRIVADLDEMDDSIKQMNRTLTELTLIARRVSNEGKPVSAYETSEEDSGGGY
jgi:anion-transporting  ArsA/GET3 family ATPase